MIKTNFNQEPHYVVFNKHKNQNTSILMVNSFSGKVVLATSDSERMRNSNEVLINNLGDNQGIEDSLIASNVISRRPTRKIDMGFYNLNVYNLTATALKEMKTQTTLEKQKEMQQSQ